MEFNGKVFLISGATGGIGKEIVKLLSKKNCKLSLFARNEEKLKQLSKMVEKNGSECIYKRCDISNKDDVRKAVEFTYEKFGRIDAAILTAGILRDNPIEKFDSNIIKNSMEINFFGNVYFLEHLLPIMKVQKSGTIAITSTLPDRRGWPSADAYCASKAATSCLIDSIRGKVKQKYNIDLVLIKPGRVITAMTSNFTGKGSIQAEKSAKIILNGLKKGKKIIQFPFFPVLITRLTDNLPAPVLDKIPR